MEDQPTVDERIASLEAATDALTEAIRHVKAAVANTALAPHAQRFLIGRLEAAIHGESHSIAQLYNALTEALD